MEIIKIENLKKTYQIAKRREGFLNNFKDLIKKEWEYKTALKGIDTSIAEGEIVGYIGPNGAGKSTTIKIMSGILYPSSGNVVVDGIVPYENKRVNAKKISLIAGQKSNLYWDLPIIDTFQLMKRIYKISDSLYKHNLDLFCETLDIKPLLNIPTRQLSLGQRMRADFAVSMLHNPKIVYLDEPTIGLDVVAKDRIREFIKSINDSRNTTIIITSHDIVDIEKICDRVIIIDNGELIYSGDIKTLKEQYSNKNCIMHVKFDGNVESLSLENYIIEKDEDGFCIYFDRTINTPSQILYKLLEDGKKIFDFTLTEPSLEDTIKMIYKNGCLSNINL